jgi:dihydrofolate synthase/folylpolyglutamate synthase
MSVEQDYQLTLQYLFEKLPMFSRIGKAALKPNLDNITRLCEALQNPHQNFPSIHLAGTNGKGSTSHMLAAVLQDAGYKVGLHTSPHLVDFRERIRINGKPISKEWVIDFVAKNKDLINAVQPSFFEINVAMAFKAFQEEAVDIAVIETGLGGRLDSTNIITPILSIITNISYDHKDLLGNTFKEIASEKAGIIKQGVPVLIGQQQDETDLVFFTKSVQEQSTLYYADATWDLIKTKEEIHSCHYKAVDKAGLKIYDLETDLLGAYQHHNIKTVLAATEILIANQGMNLTIEKAIASLANVKQTTGLRGRWDLLQTNPVVIADVAHNPAGLEQVMQQWQQVHAKQKHIVLGFVKDKEVAEALGYFPKETVFYFTQANVPRALPVDELQQLATTMGLNGTAYHTVEEAVKAAMNNMNEEDALLITGSFFIVGEAIGMGEWRYFSK